MKKNMMFLFVMCAVLIVPVQEAHAEKVWKKSRIFRVETNNPDYAGSYANYVVVKLDGSAYSADNTCSTEWVALGPITSPFFNHMYSAVLTSFTTKSEAYVKVDNSVKVAGSVCLLTDFYLQDE